MLNDDDALDVFKKAVPSALIEEKAGFLQRSYSSASRVQKVQAILSQVAIKSPHRGTIRLMLYSLKSKLKVHSKRLSRGESTMNGGFDEVTQMVDQMVEVEGKEQTADNTKQPWCNGEFDKSDREEKQEKTEIEKLDAEEAATADQIAAITDEVASLKAEIAELDKAVAEATEQRKAEHEDYSEGIQLSSTATELVKKAKNRLQKFYNPTLYKAAPVKKEMSMEEKILDAGGAFVQKRTDVAPPPPPETFGAYEKSSEKSSGVLGLMDMIVKELEDDMKEAEYDEKTAQKDYEELMTESGETRSQMVKGITDKEGAKATLGTKKIQSQEKEKGDQEDVFSINKYEGVLHGDCDFILENFDTRKEARAQEVESLKNAKAMLSGAKM